MIFVLKLNNKKFKLLNYYVNFFTNLSPTNNFIIMLLTNNNNQYKLLIVMFCFITCCTKSILFSQILPQEKMKYKTISQIPTISNYNRIICDSNSFGFYLRNLELKISNNIVYLYNNTPKYNQNAQYAIIKIDVGNKDLQQCADAVMRLKGEYLFSLKKFKDIHFCFLSDGKPRYYTDYCNGNFSYNKFKDYMNYIFSFANTASLKKELKHINNVEDIEIGDVFIQTGNPYGHAIIIVDVAINKNKEKIFMLAQSYMPAQEIHILKNPNNNNLSPWYSADFEEILETPEWTFTKNDLYRFP